MFFFCIYWNSLKLRNKWNFSRWCEKLKFFCFSCTQSSINHDVTRILLVARGGKKIEGRIKLMGYKFGLISQTFILNHHSSLVMRCLKKVFFTSVNLDIRGHRMKRIFINKSCERVNETGTKKKSIFWKQKRWQNFIFWLIFSCWCYIFIARVPK